MSIEAINEHIKLKEELGKHGILIQDIDKLLNLLSNAKENGFDPKIIVRKLRSIRRLEKKHDRLKSDCEIYSKKLQEYKDILPLTEELAALHIGIHDMISLKAAINQAVKMYNLQPLAATLRIIDDIKKYSKINGLQRELERLSLQKFAITEACARQSQAFVAMAKMQIENHGLL